MTGWHANYAMVRCHAALQSCSLSTRQAFSIRYLSKTVSKHRSKTSNLHFAQVAQILDAPMPFHTFHIAFRCLPCIPMLPLAWLLFSFRVIPIILAEEKWGQKGCLPQSIPPFVPTQARSGDPGQGGAVSVGPVWHACIAIRPTKHRYP